MILQARTMALKSLVENESSGRPPRSIRSGSQAYKLLMIGATGLQVFSAYLVHCTEKRLRRLRSSV